VRDVRFLGVRVRSETIQDTVAHWRCVEYGDYHPEWITRDD
jgi:hypothetical protein